MRDTSLLEEFLLVPEFADLPAAHLGWLAGKAADRHFQPGEILIHEGDEANILMVLVEGEIRYRREAAGSGSPTFISKAPEIGGMLPLSRMKIFNITVTALAECRVATIHVSVFPEMLSRMPQLNQHLAAIMSDRIRELTELEQQHEKSVALGKLAGGLAHEMNNPASAAIRAARDVGVALLDMRKSTLRLGQLGYPDFAWQLLFDYEQAALGRPPAQTSGLVRVDREERVTEWMNGHGVDQPWTIAAALADWDVDVGELNQLASKCPPRFLPEVLVHICSVLTAERLLSDVHKSLGRISSLVSAVKDYSFMDQQHLQEVDLHEGLESTLAMLNHRLSNVRIVRVYDRSLPRICAYGAAINQVWTNLIENAIDAIKENGDLHIRTSPELENALVEICDNGPGIPEAIQASIFDPFFTTKEVGQGTGMGLDMVKKILWNHNGSVGFQSEPGDTRFQVRIPFAQSA